GWARAASGEHRAEHDFRVRVQLGIGLRDVPNDALDVRLRAVARYARRQTPHDLEPDGKAVGQHALVVAHVRGLREGHPEIGLARIDATEARRRNADDLEGAPADDERLAYRAPVPAELLLPVRVTEDDRRWRAGPVVFLGHEEATQRGLHAQHGEVVPGDEHAIGAAGVAPLAYTQRNHRERR